MEAWELKQMQSLPLEVKILKTQQRIREWYEAWDGDVYVSFSGGKDSTVLLNLVRELYPDVEAVFIDTGLEFPEIREFVKETSNVVTVKPDMTFNKVVENYGMPVVSKNISGTIEYAQKGRPWALSRIKGLDNNGERSVFNQRYIKWAYLADAPFKISDKCCSILKKKPVKKYEKQTGNKPFIGTMASDGTVRKTNYLKHGCNAFEFNRPISTPMGFWTQQDVLEYLVKFKKPYASVYGKIIKTNKGPLITTGAYGTGCMFCMFGEQLEKGENKFQKMANTHPKQYDYCINKMGLGEVLDYIGVDYRVNNLFSVYTSNKEGVF